MDNLRDWDNPITAHKAREALKKSMASMSNDPDSGVKMCHKLGKTAVYLSEDRIAVGTPVTRRPPHRSVRAR